MSPAWLKSVLKKPQPTSIVIHDAVIADAPPIEPSSLARRIQALIKKLPTPPSTESQSEPQPEHEDDQQAPSSAPIEASEVVQALRSPIIMNGSLPDGRPSIWSVLEGMDRRNVDYHDIDTETFSDSSSVMVYSPLLPVPGSVVELAESEVIIEEEEENIEPVPVPAPPIPGWSWANTLPSVTSWFTRSTPPPAILDDNGQLLTPRTRERRLRAQRTWVPSKDKLSIQCMWWGYRIFLPPPVLDILDDKQLEATRRAAMITTALTWFFNNLPINALPLPLRPTLLLLQQIAPFLGSIGTFISWSWSAIKGYDQGYGITLTATWLLPIALIPGTWFERDWPISPPPPNSSPLPSESAIRSPWTPSPTENTVLSTPNRTPRPLAEVVLSPQHTPRALPTPLTPELTPLPITHSPSPQSPLRSPHNPPDTPNSSFTTSSPALSFVTALSSPTPKSPKLIRRSLAGLVAQSPLIRVRNSRNSRHSTPSSSRSTPLPLPSKSPHLNHTPQVDISTPLLSPFNPANPPSPYQHLLVTEELRPSPPANPNLQSPIWSPLWQCSPLPPEDTLHDDS